MNHPLRVHMVQAFRDICQLLGPWSWSTAEETGTLNGEHTRSNRFASGCSVINSLMLPFAIHSDTIANRFSVMITPINGSTFGCRRDFQVMTSLQNLCKTYTQLIDNTRREGHRRCLTFVISCKLRPRGRKALTATSRPSHSRFKTSADPPLYCTSSIAFPGNSKRSDLGSTA